MQSIGEAARAWLESMGSEDHITADTDAGDFIGDDGFLHCGVCKERKETRLRINNRAVQVPCACRRAEMAEEDYIRDQNDQMQRVQELAMYSIIGSRFKNSTFDRAVIRPDNEKPINIARKYVKNWEKMYSTNTGLLFYGPPGTGKSFLAACVANALMQRRVPVLATSIIKLTQARPEDVAETIRRMQGAKLLLLDDFGAERDTSFKIEQVFSIIDQRYASAKPLIITTNLSMQQMKSGEDMRYNRIFERIRSMCYPVKMDGESWRKQETITNYSATKELLEGGD